MNFWHFNTIVLLLHPEVNKKSSRLTHFSCVKLLYFQFGYTSPVTSLNPNILNPTKKNAPQNPHHPTFSHSNHHHPPWALIPLSFGWLDFLLINLSATGVFPHLELLYPPPQPTPKYRNLKMLLNKKEIRCFKIYQIQRSANVLNNYDNTHISAGYFFQL